MSVLSGRRAQRALIALVIFVAGVSVYSVRTADPDLWGHLRYGRLFWEAGLPPVVDPFSFDTAGVPWVAHEYLSQMLLWAVYAWAGAAGLLALKCAAGLATLALVYRTLRFCCAGPRIWAPLFVLAALLLSRFLLFRPQLFTYLGLSLFVYLLLRFLHDRPALLWPLPLVLVIWANLHGGFVAGIGVIGLALGLRLLQALQRFGWRPASLWRMVRPLVLALAGCMGASLLTPFGWRIWPFLWAELGNSHNRRWIEEWQPVRLAAPGLGGALALLLVGLLLLVWLAGMRRPGRIAGLRPWPWALSCLPLIALAFLSRRHIPILTIWAAPVLCLLAQAAWDAWPETARKRGLLMSCTALILLPALALVYVTAADPLPRIRINDESLGADRPFAAVAFMAANRLSGNLYLPLWWGSYATWELFPAVKVSMDGRNDTAYPVAAVGENLEFYKGAGDPEAPLRRAADFLLIPMSAPVLPAIEADPRWIAIYADAGAALFVRNAPAHEMLIGLHRANGLSRPGVQPPVFFR